MSLPTLVLLLTLSFQKNPGILVQFREFSAIWKRFFNSGISSANENPMVIGKFTLGRGSSMPSQDFHNFPLSPDPVHIYKLISEPQNESPLRLRSNFCHKNIIIIGLLNEEPPGHRGQVLTATSLNSM